MSLPATEVTRKINGSKPHALKGRKRSRASVLKGIRTARRRRREALAAGMPYGRTPKRTAPRGSRKPVRGRIPGGASDALIYLGHARSKLLKAAIAAGTIEVGTGSVLGLIALAIEALGGD